MQRPLKNEKTSKITIDGKGEISVASLPVNIRNEIDTLDQLKQEQTDALYEVEKCTLASQMKENQIKKLITDLLSKESTNAG